MSDCRWGGGHGTLTLALAQDYNNTTTENNPRSQSELTKPKIRSRSHPSSTTAVVEEPPCGVTNGVNRVLVVRAAYLI